jgi:molecular chaperone DnaK
VVVVPSRREMLVGARCGPRTSLDPARTITSIKRMLGRGFADPEVRALDQGVGYQIVEGPEGTALVRVDDVELHPTQIVAAILGRLRDLAGASLGKPLHRAILSVPHVTSAGFAPALRHAARFAGFEHVELVSEPVAAAWGAALRPGPRPRRAVICDFGGGTFDVALLVHDAAGIEIAGTAGDAFLGGDDLDSVLADAVTGQVHRTRGVDVRRDLVSFAALQLRAEEAKRRLSSAEETALRFTAPSLGELQIRVTRAAIEPRWQALVDRALEITTGGLKATRWSAQTVDDLVLVGGSNLVPLVRRCFVRAFSREPAQVISSDVVVAVGLARLGARKQGLEAA